MLSIELLQYSLHSTPDLLDCTPGHYYQPIFHSTQASSNLTRPSVPLTTRNLILAASTIVSRVCGKSRTINFSNECHYFTTSDGTSKRCFCDHDLCNSATRGPKLVPMTFLISLTVGFVFCKLF